MVVKKGLEGIVAAESSVSSIIDDELTYVGYKLDDLVEKSSFEEVVFLLWNLRLPSATELATLKEDLAENMDIPEEIIQHLKSYDLSTVHPMAALRTAISFLGLFDDEADVMSVEPNMWNAFRIQAKKSTIVTAVTRNRQGKALVKPNKDLGVAANLLYTSNGIEAEPLEVEVIDKGLMIPADHKLNASTFTAS